MAEISIEVEGLKELDKNLDDFILSLKSEAKKAMDLVTKNTAEDIKIIFKGRPGPGFKDRTGALRESIQGGLLEDQSTENEIVGFIGAGDDRLGSDGKQTRDYVNFVEFPEMRGHNTNRNTAFLRPGIMKAQRQITAMLAEQLSVDRII